MENKQDILLSVCLLTYNHEFFIQKAIGNAVNQQANFTYEVVIGGNCSIDNTKSITSYTGPVLSAHKLQKQIDILVVDSVNYQMPIKQKVLYWGIYSDIVKLFVYPVFRYKNRYLYK